MKREIQCIFDIRLSLAEIQIESESDSGIAIGVYLRSDMHPIRRDMNRIGLVEPDVAVDAAAFVPPALLRAGVAADGEDVLAAVVYRVGDVVAEADIAALVVAELLAVQPDG